MSIQTPYILLVYLGGETSSPKLRPHELRGSPDNLIATHGLDTLQAASQQAVGTYGNVLDASFQISLIIHRANDLSLWFSSDSLYMYSSRDC